MRTVHSIFAVAVLSAALGSYALAFTLPVSEDTSAHRRTGTLTRATGSARNLVATSTRPALVRFDLSNLPAGVTAANITSVTLRLYVAKAKGPVADVRVVPVTSDWHETDTGAVPSTDDGGAVVAAGSLTSGSFLRADVTAAIRSALSGGPDFGFLIAPTDGTIILGSKEGPATGCSAELDIESNPGPTTLGSDSVTSDAIAEGSVTSAKLASDLTLAGTTVIGGALALPTTSSATSGVITMGGTPVLHGFGGVGRNLFLGRGAGNFSIPFGGQNLTGVGDAALASNTNGNANTALGQDALTNNTSGSGNTALGVWALKAVVGGEGNTAIGYLAAYRSTGSNNTVLGFNAGSSLTSGSNNISIGHDVTGGAGESATIRIGGANQTRNFTAGIRGVTTGLNNAVTVVIDSDGQLGTVSSSRRYKEDVSDMGDASARLHTLRPVTFRYKKPYADGAKPVQFGLIAEEVAATFPELAVLNGSGQPETVKYQDLVPMLLNEVLKEHRRAETQATTIAEQEHRIDALVRKLAAMELREVEREARLTRLEGALDERTTRTVSALPDVR